MALSTLAGSRAAANLPNATSYNPGQKDQFANPAEAAGPQPSSKTYNQPVQAQPLSSPAPSQILKYPLDNNYLAYLLFRMKKINPWDIDIQTAASILDNPVITDEKGAVNQLLNAAAGGDASTDDTSLNEGQVGYPSTGTQFSDDADAEEGGVFAANRSFQQQQQAKASREAERRRTAAVSQKDILGISSQYVTDVPAIKLYLPQAINFNDVVNYNNQASLGPGGAAGLAALNAGESFTNAAKAFAGDALGFIGEALNVANTRSDVSRLALTRAIQAAPTGQKINNTAALGFQVAINPNTRTLFEGVVTREFNFQFDFYPVSQAEALVVQNIVRHFRTEMYPSTIGRGEAGVPIGYNFPNVFEIKLRIGDVQAPMPQPHLCYLRNVQTTYNPGSMSFFPDGQPTHTAMTLSFSEFRNLSREDIEEGR